MITVRKYIFCFALRRASSAKWIFRSNRQKMPMLIISKLYFFVGTEICDFLWRWNNGRLIIEN
jgi:hypothetical protein